MSSRSWKEAKMMEHEAGTAWMLEYPAAVAIELGKRLRQMRKQFHQTQREVGQKLGTSCSFIGLVECGRSGMTDETVEKICKTYHVRAEWLMFGVEPMTSDNPEDWKAPTKDETKYDAIAERIKEIRKKHRLTQKQFSQKVGCSRELIGLVEQKRQKPGKKLILRIERVFDIRHQWLMDGEGEMENILQMDVEEIAEETADEDVEEIAEETDTEIVMWYLEEHPSLLRELANAIRERRALTSE